MGKRRIVTESQVGLDLGINRNRLGRCGRDYAAKLTSAFSGLGKPRDVTKAISDLPKCSSNLAHELKRIGLKRIVSRAPLLQPDLNL